MRVRDHVALSTGTAALLYPRYRSLVVAPWAASILIDADHYVWFALRNRRLNPVAAVRSFNNAQPPKHRATRLFHHPAVLLSLLLASSRSRRALLPMVGMTFHVGLDVYHRARTARAQAAALKRDRFTCQVCGAKDAGIVPHLWRQPRLLPSYREEHFVSVCGDCHEVAHAPGSPAISAADCDWESYLRATALTVRSG